MDRTYSLVYVPLDQVRPHPKQPRTSLPEIEELAESIGEAGILYPLVLVEDASGYTIVDGHRRHAAALLAGLTQAPALVAQDWEEVDQLLAILAIDQQRKAFTAAETETGLQTLIGYDDVDVTHVSRAVGHYKPDLLEKARRGLRMLPEPKPITLEAAAMLSEVGEDEAKKLVALLDTAPHEFTWRVRQAAEKAVVLRELKEAGVACWDSFSALHRDYPTACDLGGLCDESGEALTAKSHRSCAGHVAYLGYSSKPYFACCEPENCGHGRRGGGESAADRAAQEKRELAEGEFRAATEADRDRRYAFVQSLLTPRPDNMRRVHAFAARTMATFGIGYSGCTETIADRFFDGVLSDQIFNSLPHMVMTALVVAGVERNRMPDSLHWMQGYLNPENARCIVAYLAFLEAEGYKPSPHELVIFARCAKRIEEDDAQKAKEAELRRQEADEVRKTLPDGACCGNCANLEEWECDQDGDADVCSDWTAEEEAEPEAEPEVEILGDDATCSSCANNGEVCAGGSEPCDDYTPIDAIAEPVTITAGDDD